MIPNDFSRVNMDVQLAITESNAPSSFMAGSERKALKRAKEAERAFRVSKGYDTDTFWSRCFKSLFKRKTN